MLHLLLLLLQCRDWQRRRLLAGRSHIRQQIIFIWQNQRPWPAAAANPRPHHHTTAAAVVAAGAAAVEAAVAAMPAWRAPLHVDVVVAHPTCTCRTHTTHTGSTTRTTKSTTRWMLGTFMHLLLLLLLLCVVAAPATLAQLRTAAATCRPRCVHAAAAAASHVASCKTSRPAPTAARVLISQLTHVAVLLLLLLVVRLARSSTPKLVLLLLLSPHVTSRACACRQRRWRGTAAS
jgi:hypothetical protein